MKVIDQIRQRFDATRISSTTALGVKYLPIDESDIAELEAMQKRLTELEEIVRPRPMDEAPEHREILIRYGDDHCVATWGKHFDEYGESRGPCWIDASDGTPIKCPDCWWPLPLRTGG